MQIEPWHIPLLAMTVIVLPPSMIWLVGWIRRSGGEPPPPPPPPAKRELLRTRILAVLTLTLLGVCIIAIGPAAANLIATAASAVSTMVSAALTVQSFLTLQEIQNHNNGGGNAN
ncbi:MAG: hypothetical protein ACRDRH_03215 [Pseudonocardia sp.]